jgi:ubiquinone/menaquinone biosynthesis C-methylase UbiE
METEVLQQCILCDSSNLDSVDPDRNIARCRECGYIFDNPRPTAEQLVEFYSRPAQYDSWLAALDSRDRLWKRRLRKLRSTKKPGSLLDVGTGIGQFLSIARHSYSAVYGTEVSASATQIAKQRYDLDLFQGTLDTLDLRPELFDNITLFHVLEHVHDPRSVLKRCHSLLTEQGVLVIAVPNEVASLRAFIKRVFMNVGLKKRNGAGKLGLRGISLDSDSVEVHLSHFSPRVLHQLLESSGFSIIVSTLDPYYVATGVHKFKEDIYYFFCLVIRHVFRVNVYDAILVISRKNADAQSRASC